MKFLEVQKQEGERGNKKKNTVLFIYLFNKFKLRGKKTDNNNYNNYNKTERIIL